MTSPSDPQPVEDIQGDGRWMSQHNAFLHAAKEKEPEVILIGDSLITQLGQSRLWSQMFEPLHCLNFGIGGDRTQHVLWRVVNGELDNVTPKVIVLWVGTNNFDDSVEDVTQGIMTIVAAIQERQPASHLIVMGLLPRGERPNALREKHAAVNKAVSEKLSGRPLCIFLKVEEKEFVSSDGTIDRALMYDFLHLTSEKGYQKVCDPLLDEIQSLVGNFVKVDNTSFDTASMAGGDGED